MSLHVRHGFFTLLELGPVVVVIAVLAVIVLIALNPKKQFEEIRNATRRQDVALLADAVASYAQVAGAGGSFLQSIPLSATEICGDTVTGSCTNLFSIAVLLPKYLEEAPMDPLSKDTDVPNEHSRYFIARSTENRITVSAPDREGGIPEISVTR